LPENGRVHAVVDLRCFQDSLKTRESVKPSAVCQPAKKDLSNLYQQERNNYWTGRK
ncbi:hypothetical protein R3I94_023280, partial [Phoxinus phoxinus]